MQLLCEARVILAQVGAVPLVLTLCAGQLVTKFLCLGDPGLIAVLQLRRQDFVAFHLLVQLGAEVLDDGLRVAASAQLVWMATAAA